jgi:hypothetical protein
MMDVSNVINDFVTTDWSTRPIGFTRGTIENLVALSNQLGPNAVVWINVPIYATDDYVTNLATYCDAHALYPIIIEWANETWNSFAGGTYHQVLNLV